MRGKKRSKKWGSPGKCVKCLSLLLIFEDIVLKAVKPITILMTKFSKLLSKIAHLENEISKKLFFV